MRRAHETSPARRRGQRDQHLRIESSNAATDAPAADRQLAADATRSLRLVVRVGAPPKGRPIAGPGRHTSPPVTLCGSGSFNGWGSVRLEAFGRFRYRREGSSPGRRRQGDLVGLCRAEERLRQLQAWPDCLAEDRLRQGRSDTARFSRLQRRHVDLFSGTRLPRPCRPDSSIRSGRYRARPACREVQCFRPRVAKPGQGTSPSLALFSFHPAAAWRVASEGQPASRASGREGQHQSSPLAQPQPGASGAASECFT